MKSVWVKWDLEWGGGDPYFIYLFLVFGHATWDLCSQARDRRDGRVESNLDHQGSPRKIPVLKRTLRAHPTEKLTEYPRAYPWEDRGKGALPCRQGEGGKGREVRQELPREAKPPGHVLRCWEEDFPAGPVAENLPVNAGDEDSIPGRGRSQSSEAT